MVHGRADSSGDALTYRWAGRTLTGGMYASLGLMGVGVAWWLLSGSPGGQESVSQLIPLDKLWAELAALNPLALMDLGLLVLLATPGVTLLAEIVTYAAARNWRYAGIAALIGFILLLSLALSMGWILG